MVTRRQHLLQAILDHPEDDAARLVFADWLDEYGDERDRLRAKLIRVQVEEAKLHTCDCAPSLFVESDCSTCKLVKPLRAVSRGLLLCLADEFRPLPGYPWGVIGQMSDRDSPGSCAHRGFIRDIRCTLADWLQHGPALVRQHPVERVEITDREPMNSGRDFGWFLRQRESQLNECDDLSSILGEFLPGGWPTGYNYWKFYPTRDAAHAALSTACLVYAKQKEPV